MRWAWRWLALLAATAALTPPLSGAPAPPRTLLIALDAVPFRVVAEVTDRALGDQALFAGFKGPVPLISTFPSSTSVALVGLLQPLGLERSPGYEARFFDWQQSRIRGGGPLSYYAISFPWRDFFDWSRRSPLGSAIEAIRPVRSGIRRLRRAVDEFAASEREVALIYIAATDTAVHVVGPDSVKALLRELDLALAEAGRTRSDRPFETVIFSDHGVAGGEPLENAWGAVKKALQRTGFRLSKRLEGPRDVVITPFGLVSNFEAYTHPELEAEVARTLAAVEGVELCAFATPDGWQIKSRDGAATVESRVSPEGLLWRYRVEGSDPLDYRQTLRELSEQAPELAGWVRDEELFAATQGAYFPDALHRIAHAFDLVINPASVICSLDSAHMFGAARTDLLARVGKGALRWTHGALNREATLGFLMSDAAAWQPPAAARFDRCLLPFREALSRHPKVTPVPLPPGTP